MNHKFIQHPLIAISFFVLFFSFPSTTIAQQRTCAENAFGSCTYVGPTCPAGTRRNDGCDSQAGGTCESRTWECIPINSACIYNLSFNTCQPNANACPAGTTLSVQCSNYNGDRTSCETITQFTCDRNQSWDACDEVGESCCSRKAGAFTQNACDPGSGLTCKKGVCVSPSTSVAAFNVCDNIPNDFAEEQSDCKSCLVKNGVWTALGCISFTAEGFAANLLVLATSIGGGIALLLIIYGAFLINTSSGNPEAIQNGKDMIGSAIAGLLFILFSVVLLDLIGVKILQIPGL